jgi:hypothetical protein
MLEAHRVYAEKITVTLDEAEETARLLSLSEGIFLWTIIGSDIVRGIEKS